MDWRLILRRWHSFRHHPNFLPSFTPVLLGLALLFVLLAILDNWTTIQIFRLIFLLFCSLLPMSALPIGLILLLLATAVSSGLWHLMDLGAIAISSIFLARYLRRIEWRLASQAVLSSLSEGDTNPITVITKALTLLRNYARADAAIALRQLDDFTAVAIAQLPHKTLPDNLTSPILYADAVASNQCLYYSNYAATPGAARILLAQGTKSLAVLPLLSADTQKGAILLIWYRPRRISADLKQFIASILGNLRTLLKFNDLTFSLDKLQARFGAMLQTIHQGVVFVDESGEQGWINQAAAHQLQLTPGYIEPAILAQAMAALRLSAENQVEIARQAQEFFSHPQNEIRNWNWIIRGDKPKVLSVASTPTSTGDIPGRLWLFDDISEEYFGQLALIANTNELEKAKVAAESATLTKSQFLANMSHEIRTPMNAIVGLTDVLLTTQLTNQQREFVNTIQSSSDNLLTIINDILDLSKIEAGKLELEQYCFNLRNFIEESLDLLAFKAAEKNIELAYLIAPQVPNALVADVTRLRQVLVNLLSNAVKFTSGGEVIVSVTGCKLKPQAENIDNHLYEFQFAVKDTGIGIPKERQERLFKSFSQVDSSTTRQYGGTGLGLAIGKQLSEKMGGKMWLESEVNRGSTFYFTIVAPAQSDLPVFEQDLRQLQGKKVLIVDDNQTNRQILILQTQSWGMLPIEAESGANALNLLQKQSFDLAILDMQMPHMDGLTLASEINKLGIKNLPLVLLTSIDKAEIELAKTNFTAVINKPIKQAHLYKVLDRVLNNKTVVQVKMLEKSDRSFAHSPLQILLAEDNLVNQKVALHLLQKLGYSADVAHDGLEVIECVNNRAYDVILMDVQMPKMDGLAATRQIIATSQARPRIIAMTANVMQGDREECLSAGMDDYLSKPIRLEQLAIALSKCQVKPLSRAIDLQVFQSFKAMVGEDAEAILAEIIDCYLEDAPQHLKNMAGAISQKDAAELRRAAHTLKSSSATLGATNLAALCQEMEAFSRSVVWHDSSYSDAFCASHTEDSLEKLRQIEAEYKQVLVALQALRPPDNKL